MNIYIIDDDQAFRYVLARSLMRLTGETNTIETFASAKVALNAVDNNTPDVILLDMKLADESGLQWIEPFRQASENAQIIIMTGYASIATTVQAIKLGADDYLPKPLNVETVLATIDEKHPLPVENADQVMSLRRIEWEHIQRALDDNDGNISAAARQLGMHRRTLQRKLQKRPVS